MRHDRAGTAGAGRAEIVFDKVSIAYRGAKYELGRGRGFFGIWMTGAPRSQPMERWPETDDGWSAAWGRFTAMETPGTIVPAGTNTPPAPPGAPPGEAPGGTSYGQYTPSYGQYAPGYGQRLATASGGRAAAAALLGVGVLLGIAGLFPAYLGGSSLARQSSELIPHVIYLAGWTAGAVLILLGGARLRIGALFSLGLSAVTFGLFLADVGTAIAAGNSAGGAGLVLSVVGWVACAAGSVLAIMLHPAGQPGYHGALARPRGAQIGPFTLLVLAGLGVAAAFAPAWDSFTLRTAAGQTESLTAGNAFSNPGIVIAGNVAVMIALAVAVIAAAFWRPARHGAALLAGAVVPMVAQAVSALVQASQAPSPSQFGISPAQAARVGLTISSGVTPAFWIYCGFLVVLAVSCAWMVFMPQLQAGPGPVASAGPATWNSAPDPDRDGEEPDGDKDGDDGTGIPEYGVAPSHVPGDARDGDTHAA